MKKYPIPKYAEALILYLIEELSRLFYFANGEKWDTKKEIKIPSAGIEWQPYKWIEEKREAQLPIFKFKGVTIYLLDGIPPTTKSNKRLTMKQWIKWFNDCYKMLDKYEKEELTIEVLNAAYHKMENF